MENKSQKEIGEKVRSLRKERNIKINEVAAQTGLTSSFISQFERGLTKASIDSIIKIMDVIGVKFSVLFETETETPEDDGPMLIRKNERQELSYPLSKSDMFKEYLLTPPSEKLEVYITEMAPDTSTESSYSHTGDEFLLILKGRLELNISDNEYTLDEGDSITVNSSLLKSWSNIHGDITEVLWVIHR